MRLSTRDVAPEDGARDMPADEAESESWEAKVREWLFKAIIVSALLATVALSVMAYTEACKPDPPAPVIEVIEVDDPDLATALMIVGRQQVEIQNLIHLHAQYGKLLDLYQQELLRKVAQK